MSFIVAPATGTPETGGWSTRELRTILRGLDGLNLVGADVVEVAVSPRPRDTSCQGEVVNLNNQNLACLRHQRRTHYDGGC